MILTDYSRPKDLIRFKRSNGANTYLILGGTTSWVDDNNPPEIPDGTKTIPDAFAACKATVMFGKKDVAGTYAAEIPDENGVPVVTLFSEIASEAALLAYSGEIFAILQATLSDSDIPLITNWRKLGFATDLVPDAGHEADTFLLAADVTTWGQLETLEYRKPYPVNPGAGHIFREVIQY